MASSSLAVTLLGPPGIGKTTLLRALGERLQCPYLELSIVPEFRVIAGRPTTYEVDERIAIQNLVLWARNYFAHGHNVVLLSDFRLESVSVLRAELAGIDVLPIALTTSQPNMLIERLGARKEGFRDVDAAVAANAAWRQLEWQELQQVDVADRSKDDLVEDLAGRICGALKLR